MPLPWWGLALLILVSAGTVWYIVRGANQFEQPERDQAYYDSEFHRLTEHLEIP